MTEPPPPPPPTPPRDTVAPRVTFTAGPAAATAELAATFAFAANEPKVSFACRLDGGGWLPCSSPHTVQGLALGAHALAVRATDGAGNVGAATTRQWTVTPPPDTTPPTVSFTQTPPSQTTSKTATFAFAASEQGVTFACSYDNAAFAPCQTPHTLNDVGIDDHTFAVRATDTAGNTGSAASFAWNVVAPLPDLVAVLTDTTVTVRNVGEGAAGASIVTVPSIGTFTIQALGPGQSATRTFTCRRGTITATADATRLVAESNEGNNVATNVASCI
jgi:hypothetical protein